MDDMNLVILEGVVKYNPEIREANGKPVINFLVENRRRGQNQDYTFRYHCVAWGKVAERVEESLKEGVFVRVTGHLQDNVMELADGKQFHYSKTCADHIEFYYAPASA